MKKSPTIADIADALHLSRNTVSKALNGKHISPKTKQRIFDTAVQMGYKSFDLISSGSETAKADKKILILSSVPLLTANYYIYLIRGIMAQAEHCRLEILQYVFQPDTDFETIKRYIYQFGVDGILCIEFFKKELMEDILSLDIPTVFLDCCCDENIGGDYDVVLSDNGETVRAVVRELAAAGAKRFAFIGNPFNCKGFFERYMGLRAALIELDLPFREDLSILKGNAFPYGNAAALGEFYRPMPVLPDCIVCANDFIALALIDALKQRKHTDLAEINIIGFDNIPESRLKSPKLSTVNIDKQALGRQAVDTLLERIASPRRPHRYIYLRNNFVKRETTPFLHGDA